MTWQPLSPWLYGRLLAVFGRVKVSNAGQQAVGQVVTDPVSGKRRWQVSFWGESYRVCCPFCGDRKFHLWLPYVFGMPDPANPQWRLYNVGRCFRRECLKNRQLRDQLVAWLTSGSPMAVEASWTVSPVALEDTQLPEAKPPGDIVPLERCRDLPATEYVAGKGLTPRWLTQFQVGVVGAPSPSYPRFLAGALYIPCFVGGKLRGWQCRTFGSACKYYSMPGGWVSRVLYKSDNSTGWPFVVLMEGPSDVWKFGNGAVALLGKELGEHRMRLLEKYWPGAPVVVCLDADDEDARLKQQRLVQQLSSRLGVPVLGMELPQGKDPGDLETEELYQLLYQQAKATGIPRIYENL